MGLPVQLGMDCWPCRALWRAGATRTESAEQDRFAAHGRQSHTGRSFKVPFVVGLALASAPRCAVCREVAGVL